MGKETVVVKGGFKFTTILFFIFLVLKLTGLIDWSWWWVTFPLWAGYAFLGLILLGIIGIGIVVALSEKKGKR